MKIENAIKLLSKENFNTLDRVGNNLYSASKLNCNYLITVRASRFGLDRKILTITVRHKNDQSKIYNDSLPGLVFPSIAQAIKYANAA